MLKFLRVFEKIYFFWIVIGLLVFVLLFPKLPLTNVAGTYVAIRLEDIWVSLVVGLWLIVKLPQLKNLTNERIIQAFLLFWAIGFLSFISGLFVTYSVTPNLGFLHWLRRIEYMSLFLVAATTFYSRDQVKMLLKIGLVATLIICFYGFGQQWLNFPVVSTTNREFSKGQILYLTPDARVNSTFAGHYDLAIFMSMALAVISSLFFFYNKILEKSLVSVVGLLSFLILGLTAARVSFVAALAGIAITLLLHGKRLLIFLLILAALVSIGAIPELRHRLVATFTVSFLGGGGPKYTIDEDIPVDRGKRLSLEERQQILDEATRSAGSNANFATVAADLAPGEPINTTELGVYRSFRIRLDVEWPRAIRAFVRNPLLGTGYSSLGIATDNDILRSFGEVGILGTLGLALIFFIIFKRLFRQIQHGNRFARFFGIGILGMIVAFGLNAMFLDVFEASKVATFFWALLGVNWALANMEVGNEKS